MNNWAVWLLISIVFFVIEGVSVSIMSIWFGLGALLAMIVSIFTKNYIAEIFIFLISSLVLIYFTKPLAEKYVKPKKTNALSMIGQEAVVIQKIDNIAQTGQIKFNGNIWSARSADSKVTEPGRVVTVVEIKGVTAYVTEKNSKEES